MKCGLIGERLSHSYSKQIHAAICDYEYELYPVPRDAAAEMIKSEEYSGLNVTIPYKELAYSLCDELDDFAKEAKSVNTVIHRDGKVCGYNTDIFGFIEMVKSAGISFSGKNVLILGSGGTSKTAFVASRAMNAARIDVCSRSGAINYENVYDLSDTQIIINTTPVGMYPKTGVVPCELSRFEKCEGVVDVIYNPEKTALLFEAERLGIKNVGGLRMLAAQAFRAAEIFTGSPLPDSLIDSAEKSVARVMRNIVLIGMPGSGKSSIAKEIGARMGRQVIDTDDVIEERFGAPRDIITERGEDEFRKLETEILAEFGKESGYVISTGGGIVEREENLGHISQNGRVYLIRRELSSLDTAGRPLSKDIEKLYEHRREKYERFKDAAVDNNKTVAIAADAIISDFEENV